MFFHLNRTGRCAWSGW